MGLSGKFADSLTSKSPVPFITMSSAWRKPDVLVFDSDIAHRWSVFRRDFEHYVTIAYPAATPAVKASLLLNLAGPEAQERSESFVYGPNESAQDPVCLLAKFTALCVIPTNYILERFKLFSRRQNPGESVDNFAAALRHLARRCSLDTLTPEIFIRDVLVYGLRDENLRAELIRKPDLTIKEAVRASRLAEAVTLAMSPPDHDIRAASVTSCRTTTQQQQLGNPPPGARTPQRCPNCNFASHRFNVCPALGKTCNFCHKQNHFSAACR